MVRRLTLLAALCVIAAVSGGALPATAQTPITAEISAAGAGGVKLGGGYKALRRHHLIAKRRKGCELDGPGNASARLLAPLEGSVNLTRKSPRRVTSIIVTGGATARGVGVGATTAEIQAAFPGAEVDHGTEQVFAITLVKIPKDAGGRIEFAVDLSTGKVSSIGVPFIPFCE